MRIKFTISTPTETRTYIREYEPNTPAYEIADDAYMEAIDYINTHNMTTLEEVDCDWNEVDKNEPDPDYLA